jgi:hypothetical protein
MRYDHRRRRIAATLQTMPLTSGSALGSYCVLAKISMTVGAVLTTGCAAGTYRQGELAVHQ